MIWEYHILTLISNFSTDSEEVGYPSMLYMFSVHETKDVLSVNFEHFLSLLVFQDALLVAESVRVHVCKCASVCIDVWMCAGVRVWLWVDVGE